VQIFALAAPAIAMLSVGAVELSVVASHKATLQAAADAAALNAASQIGVAKEGVLERAKAFALEQAKDITNVSTVTAEAELVKDGMGVKVTLLGVRPSFFGDLLPPGGFRTRVQSVAVTMNTLPLCVLAQRTSGSKVLNLLDQSQIVASGCLVHSNKDIAAEASSTLLAGSVQASGQASGHIIPTAAVGAPQSSDPFATVPTTTTAGCSDDGKIKAESGEVEKVPAGVHCGTWEAGQGSILELQPGTHYFRGAELNIKDNSKLYGRDVVLIFDKDSKLKFQDQAIVDLEGRKSGPHAGFLIITARDNTRDLEIWSDNVDNLLGVIYAPAAKLLVIGKEEIAEASDWTVVVAKEIQLKESARLTINSHYSGSLVPVPTGVGPSAAGAKLAR